MCADDRLLVEGRREQLKGRFCRCLLEREILADDAYEMVAGVTAWSSGRELKSVLLHTMRSQWAYLQHILFEPYERAPLVWLCDRERLNQMLGTESPPADDGVAVALWISRRMGAIHEYNTHRAL